PDRTRTDGPLGRNADKPRPEFRDPYILRVVVVEKAAQSPLEYSANSFALTQPAAQSAYRPFSTRHLPCGADWTHSTCGWPGSPQSSFPLQALTVSTGIATT